jgi:NAD(P)-dependent dehydrogenase (short-subunit alcohol dehydrogenase family)
MVAETPMPSPFPTWHNDIYAAIDPTRPELSAKDKHVIITGGGSGIGPQIAHSFALAGAKTIGIIGRTERTLLETKSGLETEFAGLAVYHAVADIVDDDAIDRAFASITSRNGGKIDVLVSNAGYLPDPAAIKESKGSEWFKGYEINVKGSYNVVHAFLHYAAVNAVLINVSTGAAHVPPIPGMSAYSTSKFAATRFFEYVQAENPQIRVANVHPGVVATQMEAKSRANGYEFPMDTIDLPANFIVWVASPEAEFTKGKYLWVNWDVDEIKAAKEEFKDPFFFGLGLVGWPHGKVAA